jgi:hypothetical protein
MIFLTTNLYTLKNLVHWIDLEEWLVDPFSGNTMTEMAQHSIKHAETCMRIMGAQAECYICIGREPDKSAGCKEGQLDDRTMDELDQMDWSRCKMIPWRQAGTPTNLATKSKEDRSRTTEKCEGKAR